MLSKVGIVCYFVYIVICVCVFVTLLTGGNKEIYLSIYQVHFGINRAISILISTTIDIIFVIFKNDRGMLDYNKMQPRPKVFCVSSSRYLCFIYSLGL